MDTQKQKVSRKFLKSEIKRLENELSELKEFNTTVIANNYLKFQQIDLLKKEVEKQKAVIRDRIDTIKIFSDRIIGLRLEIEKKERSQLIYNCIYLGTIALSFLLIWLFR